MTLIRAAGAVSPVSLLSSSRPTTPAGPASGPTPRIEPVPTPDPSKARHSDSNSPDSGAIPIQRSLRATTMRHVATIDVAPWSRAHQTRLFVVDAVLVAFALTVAFVVRFALGFPGGGIVEPTTSYVLISLLLFPGWLLALSMERSRDRRIVGVGVTEYHKVFQATWKFFAVVAGVSYLLRFDLARGYVAVALPLGIALLLGGRFHARRWLQGQRSSGECLSPLIVAGSRAGVLDLITELHANPQAGYVVVGACVPDGDRELGALIEGVPVLGDVLDVPAAVRQTGARSVAVGGCDSLTSTVVRNLGWELETTGTELIVVPGLVDVAGPRVLMSPAEGLSLVHIDAPTFSGGKYLAKTVIDWLLALGAVVVLAVPLALVAVVVKATSPGSVLYRQERIGRDGTPFQMLKFRSMRTGADAEVASLADLNEAGGPLFKIRDDPRVTTIGRYMRRYSIDELPQFFNVLRGDMALVGPRPQLPGEVAKYDGHAARRLLVKPGITGLWQVSGRSDLEWKVGLRKDVFYTENWTVFSDFVILAKTFKAIVAHKGAY
ncbi:sugar transferase [Sanguibacter gelidistatuariae]|nr:sugar transferase [Sanguibacter gelidistatuariae]